ncbi:potassium channel family protein [Candidatus Poribacteria bacterium]|nr:potassium channel family protein [Candidatus Poribacteria bacterium]
MYEKYDETIEARELLKALESDASYIILNNCTIEGVVDLFSAELERDENDRICINKTLSCIGCTFKNVVNFRTAVFQQEVSFRRSVFEADVDFDESTFQHQSDSRETMLHSGFRETTFAGRANFHSAVFHRSVSFWRAIFRNVADFHQAQFLNNAVFHEAQFHKEANFSHVLFQRTLDCTGTNFAQVVVFNRSSFIGRTLFTAAKFAAVASFRDVQYIPNTIRQSIVNRFTKNPKKPTEFYLDSQHVDEVANPFFKRYVADQQFIRAFSKANPMLARLWRWSSDYGRNLGLWAFWSLFFALLFAIAYMPFPSWTPEWMQTLSPQFHQATGQYSGEQLTFWNSFYFSIVTFTTLGFGDVVADNATARLLVTLEVIFGYLMLGGLISIFANKLASRS